MLVCDEEEAALLLHNTTQRFELGTCLTTTPGYIQRVRRQEEKTDKVNESDFASSHTQTNTVWIQQEIEVKHTVLFSVCE